MKLDNFQNEINSVIFARGVRYFQAGKVTRIEETEKGFYEAVVSGNYDYDVEIRIGSENNTVLSFYCDCPYGSFCKHCAAVLLQIRKMKSENRTDLYIFQFHFSAEPSGCPFLLFFVPEGLLIINTDQSSERFIYF